MKISWVKLVVICAAICVSFVDAKAQMGHILQGSGAENRAMEGASTGNPINGIGASYWNIAGLSRADKSSLKLSMEYFSSDLQLGLGGSLEDSDYSPDLLPTLGFIYVPKDSEWTFGLGVESVAGFGVDAPRTGPGINSAFMMGQMTLGASYDVTEKLSLGFATILSVAGLEVDPFIAETGFPATDMEYAPGYGFQFGILYSINEEWSVGASHKTTQDFKSFRYSTNGQTFAFDMDFPSITSAGFGYMGVEDLTINVDIRYIDYSDTDGFAEPADFEPGPGGKLKGFGWDSIWQIAIGAAYDVNDELTLMCGYSYNENPIDDKIAFANFPAPAVVQHHASIGCAYQISASSTLHAAWSHGFKNSIRGVAPDGVTPADASLSTDSIMLGFAYNF